MTQKGDLSDVMTDADFEKALDALREQEPSGEVGELLKMMNENRMISWEEAEQILGGTSYNEPVKSSLPEQTRPTEPDNDTDVDWSIQKLAQNDPKLKQINLNNMKRTPIPQLQRLINAVRNNTVLEKLALANMGLYDGNLEPLIDIVENNSTLKALNLETNYLSGDFFARLFKAALKNQTLEEVKAVNQGVTFSTLAEKEIIDAIFENKGLIKVSINLRLPEGRHKIENAMLRNGEIKRILRRQAAANQKMDETKQQVGDTKPEIKEQFSKDDAKSSSASSKTTTPARAHVNRESKGEKLPATRDTASTASKNLLSHDKKTAKSLESTKKANPAKSDGAESQKTLSPSTPTKSAKTGSVESKKNESDRGKEKKSTAAVPEGSSAQVSSKPKPRASPKVATKTGQKSETKTEKNFVSEEPVAQNSLESAGKAKNPPKVPPKKGTTRNELTSANSPKKS